MGTMQRCAPSQAPRKLLDVLAVSERALTSLVERSLASEADFTQGGTRPNCPKIQLDHIDDARDKVVQGKCGATTFEQVRLAAKEDIVSVKQRLVQAEFLKRLHDLALDRLSVAVQEARLRLLDQGRECAPGREGLVAVPPAYPRAREHGERVTLPGAELRWGFKGAGRWVQQDGLQKPCDLGEQLAVHWGADG